MTQVVVDTRTRQMRSTRLNAVVLLWVAATAVVFVGVAAVPYFLSSGYGPPEYAPRRGWLLMHIVGGVIALLTGPVQLWLGLADRGMMWHRRLGVGYLTGVGIGSFAAVYLATHTDLGWIFGAGLLGMAAAWITTTALAYLAITRSVIEQHKEWMIRSYVVTFAFVTFRLIQPGLQAAGVGTPPEQLAFAAWAAWSIPLIVTEGILQGRKILAVSVP